MNATILLDNLLIEQAKTLAPHLSLPSAGKPYGISGFLTLLAPGHNTVSNYVYREGQNFSITPNDKFSKLSFVNK